jgi:excisionase family DNA binding protein
VGYLTVKQVADELSFTERAVHKWIKEGRIAALKIGRDYRISEEDFQKFKEKHFIPAKD